MARGDVGCQLVRGGPVEVTPILLAAVRMLAVLMQPQLAASGKRFRALRITGAFFLFQATHEPCRFLLLILHILLLLLIRPLLLNLLALWLLHLRMILCFNVGLKRLSITIRLIAHRAHI